MVKSKSSSTGVIGTVRSITYHLLSSLCTPTRQSMSEAFRHSMDTRFNELRQAIPYRVMIGVAYHLMMQSGNGSPMLSLGGRTKKNCTSPYLICFSIRGG